MSPPPRRRAVSAVRLAATTVLAATAAVALAQPAHAAAAITVATDGSRNYTTIQAAIAAATTGTVITIKAGTYRCSNDPVP
jgi:pectinesterase